MSDIIAGILILIGSGFVFIAGLGILRLGDTLNRMHASTKAGTLGSILALAGGAVQLSRDGTTVKAVAIILFLLLTAPVAAHMIGRATVQLRAFKAQHPHQPMEESRSSS